MADRGRPLPFAVREQIKADRQQGATVRAVADARGVSKTTVQKYGRASLVQNDSHGTPNR
jgi:response regulator of citrate/malate metabolism